MMHRTSRRTPQLIAQLPPGRGADRRPRRTLLPAGAALALLLLPALIGCPPDNRISLDALRRIEADVATEMATDDIKQIDAAQLAVAENRPYTIGPRDVLSVTMYGVGVGEATSPYAPFTIQARVNAEGDIKLPQVGAVHVADMSLGEAETAIHDAHVDRQIIKQDLTVYVELVSSEVTTVLVTGAATTRGLISLRSNERNVLYALALAGGYAAGTSGVVTVKRVDPTAGQVAYDLTQPEDIRRALLSPPLETGDMIAVGAASTSAIYLTGLVNVPGPIAVPEGSTMTVTRAISAGGGLADFIDPTEATLWRRLPDGEQVRAKINLKDIMSGKEPDFTLMAGDILDVPHTPGTRFRAWVLANIRIGPFGVSTVWDPVAAYRFREALDRDEQRFGQQGGFSQSVLDTIRFGLPNVIVPPVTPPP